jgi:hypothetical protein
MQQSNSFKDSLGILSDVTTPPPQAQSTGAQGFRDSLGILAGQGEARFDSLGDLQPITPIEERKDFSPGATGYRDSLGILSGSSAPAMRQDVLPYEAPPMTEALQTRSFAPRSGSLVEQVGGQTEADIARVGKGLLKKEAEAEIQRRLAALVHERYRQEQAAMGVQTEPGEEPTGGGFMETLLSEQPKPLTPYQAEVGGIEANPWVDPTQAGPAAFGAAGKVAISRGAKVLPAIGRGLAAAVPATVMEYPLGAVADAMADKNPEIALLGALALGITSGLTIENLSEKGLLKLTRTLTQKHPEKAAQLLPQDVLERFKPRPTETAPPAEAIPDIEAQRLERRRAQAAARVQPQPEEVPYSRSGGSVENVITTPAAEGKQFRDSLNILNPPSERSVVWGPQDLEATRGQAWLAQQQGQERRAASAVKTDSFRTWVSMTGGINPNDPSYRGEIRDITRGATRGQGYPPGFLSNNARSLDVRTSEAIEAGWLPRGATEDDFMDAVQRDAKKRLADVGVDEELIRRENERVAKEEEYNKSINDWIVDQGGLKPEADLSDVVWTRTKTARGVKATPNPGFPQGFINTDSENWLTEVLPKAVKEGFLPEGSAMKDLLAAIRKDAAAAASGGGERVTRRDEILWMHPGVITSPLGGIISGVSVDENGQVSIDPKKALYGALIGAAGGAALPKAKALAARIAHTWDEKVAEPFLNLVKNTANGLIVNENLRAGLGLGRSQVFKDMFRNYKRDVEQLWGTAAEIGHELQEIAPTKVEQKRLMQIIKGSITANPELKAKADKVRILFDEMREELKDHNLLEYSRFDRLTRAERAGIRRALSGPDPATLKNPELIKYAQDLGVQQRKGPFNRDNLIKDVQAHLKFQRGRLNDFYHSASAQEYAPIYYTKQEGLSPEQTKVLQEEIDHLKVKSRRGNPEGKQDIEALISKLEAMLGTGAEARKQQRITHQALVKSYSHQRMEIPVEVQRVMGLIEEAPFPVAKGLGVQQTDIRKARLFEDIEKQPGFTIRPRKGVDIPGNYHLVEDERFGALNGQYVRKDIWNDLREVEEWRGAFVRNWDKYLGWWKFGKAVLNPATQVRNGLSNSILAYLGDVNPWDVKTYAKAAQAMKQGEENLFYKEAKKWGLFNQTFYSTEIGKLRDELASIRDPSKMKDFVRKAFSVPADLYEGNEKFFKLAVFIKARESGMSIEDAARKAEKFLFNYSDIPPWVKHTKRWASPFFTFTYKAVPLFAEMAIKKPWKVGAIMAAVYGMEEFAKAQLGLSDEEAAKERKTLADWQQKRIPPVIGPHTQVLVPWQDKYGSNLYLDLSYILPYGNVGEKWGQSALPLSDLLPSNPLFQMSAAILTNRDAFTGRPIYNEVLDSAGRVAAKYLEYSWREIAPSMSPGGYSWDKIKTGLMNTFTDEKVLDWADRPVELQTALLSSLLGIKLSPADTQKLKQFQITEMNKISRSVSDEIGRLRRDKEKNKINDQEFREEVKRVMDLKKNLIQQRR